MLRLGQSLFCAAAITLSAPALAQEGPGAPDYAAQAKEIFKKSISFQTVEGRGQVPAYANYLAGVLREAGFSDDDIEIAPVGETATFVAWLRGDSAEKPILIGAHMDVVEADPADWERDPFTAVEENGYIFGRGASDNKFGAAIAVVTLARLKKEGFKPKRDIILAFSGDEETQMATTALLAERFKHADLYLNTDAGGGGLNDEGEPSGYVLQGAEKTYADFLVTFRNDGGHSSAPRKDNAIYSLTAALQKIADYEFPAQTSEITLKAIAEMAPAFDDELAEAMRRFAANPKDKKAIRRLRADPRLVGQIGTTCVATMIDAGHAPNALPQRAAANVNCRIFPGVDPEGVRQTLIGVIDDAAATVDFVDDVNFADASPLRDDVMSALRNAVDARFPGLAITPMMSAGATDALHFRARGVDSYGVGGLFMKSSDSFAHGLNERVPADAFVGALEHWHVLLTELAG